ncbi:DoxX family protein [Azospirillum sp. sgz301742]
MTLSKRDFDLSEPAIVVRMMCGLLYIPHILFKLNAMDGAAAFFGKAGFTPPMAFVVLALVMETVCAVGLTFNIHTKWVGLLSAGVMAVAAYAVFATKGVGWLWNLGGVEYLAFWGVSSLALAAHAWKQERKTYGRITLFGHAHSV